MAYSNDNNCNKAMQHISRDMHKAVCSLLCFVEFWYRAPFTNGFSIAIQIRWKFRFTITSILIQWSLQRFTWCDSCAVVACAKMMRADGQQRNYSEAKFPSHLNCGQKIVSEAGHWSIFNHILQGFFTGICDSHAIAPVPIKYPWRMRVNRSHESIRDWWYDHKSRGKTITVTSHERHVVWHNLQLFIQKACSYKQQQKYQSFAWLALCEKYPLVDWWIPLTKA